MKKKDKRSKKTKDALSKLPEWKRRQRRGERVYVK